MAIVLNQLFHYHLNPSIKNLYYKGKAYELLSLYFNRSEDANVEQCPFLIDEENVLKIRKAKEIVLENMAEPPTLEVLSEQVGLSLKKLKLGFKQIYGDTVYGFLFDYKMEYARQLLDSGSYNVNEVGLKIGYSTASHFIAAFKKKFGITPKKYIEFECKYVMRNIVLLFIILSFIACKKESFIDNFNNIEHYRLVNESLELSDKKLDKDVILQDFPNKINDSVFFNYINSSNWIKNTKLENIIILKYKNDCNSETSGYS